MWWGVRGKPVRENDYFHMRLIYRKTIQSDLNMVGTSIDDAIEEFKSNKF
jgi:hypothetical protein